jgi:hypothetical protein
MKAGEISSYRYPKLNAHPLAAANSMKSISMPAWLSYTRACVLWDLYSAPLDHRLQ